MCTLASIVSILLSVVTLTVESKSSVSLTQGMLPEGSSIHYESTYKKGQLTQGNNAVLQLSGWQDQVLERITLDMRSNKSSGSGSLTMTADGENVWQIADAPFSAKTWYGSYTTDTVSVTHEFEPNIELKDGDIAIEIAATVSSLYIVRYTLHYHAAAPRAHTVQLMTSVGSVVGSLTEDMASSGITLPYIDWTIGDWHFSGWAENLYEKETQKPTIFEAGTVYYPQRDGTLYAIFTNEKEIGAITATDEIAEAEAPYLFVIATAPYAILNGAPEGGNITISSVKIEEEEGEEGKQILFADEIRANNIYYIQPTSESSCLIRHHSGTNIGHNGTNIATNAQEWQIRQKEDTKKWQFYYEDGEKEYNLCVGLANDIPIVHAALRPETDYYLFNIKDQTEERIYTFYPLDYLRSNPQTTANQHSSYTLQWGVWKLQIENGHKKLITP